MPVIVFWTQALCCPAANGQVRAKENPKPQVRRCRVQQGFYFLPFRRDAARADADVAPDLTVEPLGAVLFPEPAEDAPRSCCAERFGCEGVSATMERFVNISDLRCGELARGLTSGFCDEGLSCLMLGVAFGQSEIACAQ